MIKNRRRLVNNQGYILYWKPKHPRAETLGAYAGYVYEHVVVAERNIGRLLEDREEVHHMDFNRANNSRNNLLVLLDSEHAKLHIWLRTNGLDRKVTQLTYDDNKNRLFLRQCHRCRYCRWPTDKEHHCSKICKQRDQLRTDEKIRDQLESFLHRHLSWREIGRRLDCSDNGAKKLARRLSLL